MAWWGVLWTIEIRDFGNVRVRKAYKCPQMSTMKFLVHEIFEFCGFCTGQVGRCTTAKLDGLVGSFVKNWNSWFLRCEGWKGLQMCPNEYHRSLRASKFWLRWVLHHDIARWLGGEYCEKLKFVTFEMWELERPTNVPKWIPWKSWCTKVLSSVGFAHGQGWRCTTTYLDGLVGSFVKKWNSWSLRCEGWKGLQMSPKEYHESLGARKFWVRWVLHMAKVGGAPRHS